MLRRSSLLLALSSLAVACKQKPADATGDVIGDATAYQAHFDRWCDEAGILLPVESDATPPAPWPNPARPSAAVADYVLEVTPSRVIVNGTEPERWIDALSPTPDAPSPSWALVPSADTQVADVVRITEAIAKKLGPRGSFYFTNPGIELAGAPDRARADAELGKLMEAPADFRSVKLAGLLDSYAGNCESFVDVMTAVGKLDADARCGELAARMPAALAGCTNSDREGTMAVLYLLFGASKPARAELPFELAGEAGPGVAELQVVDGHEPWGEAAARWFQTPPVGPVHFVGVDRP